MTESNDSNLEFPIKLKKSKSESKIIKNKKIQNIWNFVKKTRTKEYYLQ